MDETQFILIWFLFISIIQVNSQNNNRLIFNLYEETPESTFIADIRTEAKLSLHYSQEELIQIRYIFLSSSEYSEYFTIDNTNGILRTKRRFDRESICARESSCHIKLDIGLQPNDFFRVIKIQINILDINDNPPVFPETFFVRNIEENAMLGSSFFISAADDLDSPKFGISHYKLIQTAPEFDIKIENGTEDTLDVYLILKKSLDREKVKNYELVLAAYDKGVPPKIGTATIQILVQDINDNKPIFNKQKYQVEIAEDIAVNSVIITVTATDNDAGNNGKIIYGLSPKSERNFGEYFGIDEISGAIYIKKNLKYEIHENFNLVATARDLNPNSMMSSTNIYVEVIDINDNPPDIVISSPPNTNIVTLPEDSKKDTFVAFLTVTDLDTGEGGQFSCSMDHPMFYLDKNPPSEFMIKTKHLLDRERDSQFELIFSCRDFGSPKLSSSISLTININDINDNSPTFDLTNYSVKLNEGFEKGKTFLTVKAIDSDIGDNGRVVYSLSGKNSYKFHIEPSLGDIKIAIPLDYEFEKMYNLSIIAEDMGNPSRSSSVPLTIMVTDADDNFPIFMPSKYTFNIREDKIIGSQVGQVVAEDKDSNSFNSFTYKLNDNTEDSSAFHLDAYSGKLYTKNVLDRELRHSYSLRVQAISDHNQTKYTEALVNIIIDDVNDNAPYFIFPNDDNKTLSVSAYSKVGQVVGQIIAEDKDAGMNSKLSFYIKDENQMNILSIDSISGIIRVKSSMKKIAATNLFISVGVKDSGLYSLRAETLLNIYLNRTAILEEANMNNLTIVICVAVISLTIIVGLIIAIVLTRSRCTAFLFGNKKRRPSEGEKNNRLSGEMKDIEGKFAINCLENSLSQAPVIKSSLCYDKVFFDKMSDNMSSISNTDSMDNKIQKIDLRNDCNSYDSLKRKALTEGYPSSMNYHGSNRGPYYLPQEFYQKRSNFDNNSDSGRGSNEDMEDVFLRHNDSFNSTPSDGLVLRPPIYHPKNSVTSSMRSNHIINSVIQERCRDFCEPISNEPQPLLRFNQSIRDPDNSSYHSYGVPKNSKHSNALFNKKSQNIRLCNTTNQKQLTLNPKHDVTCDDESSGPEMSDEEQEYVYYVQGHPV